MFLRCRSYSGSSCPAAAPARQTPLPAKGKRLHPAQPSPAPHRPGPAPRGLPALPRPPSAPPGPGSRPRPGPTAALGPCAPPCPQPAGTGGRCRPHGTARPPHLSRGSRHCPAPSAPGTAPAPHLSRGSWHWPAPARAGRRQRRGGGGAANPGPAGGRAWPSRRSAGPRGGTGRDGAGRAGTGTGTGTGIEIGAGTGVPRAAGAALSAPRARPVFQGPVVLTLGTAPGARSRSGPRPARVRSSGRSRFQALPGVSSLPRPVRVAPIIAGSRNAAPGAGLCHGLNAGLAADIAEGAAAAGSVCATRHREAGWYLNIPEMAKNYRLPKRAGA